MLAGTVMVTVREPEVALVRDGWAGTNQLGVCMAAQPLFSRNAMLVVGAVLVLIMLWVVYNIGGVAISRWFG
jgi:ABC-type dipeptide/oligopeptide/nickel transport system permease subunit